MKENETEHIENTTWKIKQEVKAENRTECILQRPRQWYDDIWEEGRNRGGNYMVSLHGIEEGGAAGLQALRGRFT